MQIKEKNVMITGGSSGIGLQLAKTLLAEGARVMICSKDEAGLAAVTNQYPGIIAYVCDLSQPQQVRELVNKTGGVVDIWVNNGGIFLDYSFLNPDKTFESLENELRINFVAAALAITELVPFLFKKPESAIVNITAGMIFTPLVRNPMYNASKSALHSYILSARKQLSKTGIRMIEIVPPMVATRLTEGMKGKRVSPTLIADAVIRALRSREDTVLIGQVKNLALLSKFFPGLMINLLNKGWEQT